MRKNSNKHASRDRLHKTHIDHFLEYAKSQGWTVLESPPQAIYEACRIKHPDGKVPLIFFARTGKTEHVTVPEGAWDLVVRYYKFRKDTGLTKPRHRNKDLVEQSDE